MKSGFYATSALWYILKLLVLASWQGFYSPIDPENQSPCVLIWCTHPQSLMLIAQRKLKLLVLASCRLCKLPFQLVTIIAAHHNTRTHFITRKGRQHGMRSLPNTSTHDQWWEWTPDFWSWVQITTLPHAPTSNTPSQCFLPPSNAWNVFFTSYTA